MSNATQRNFAAAARERDLRQARINEGEDPVTLAQASYLGPEWDAFYGSLRQKADDAAASGMGFKADLTGIGQNGGGLQGGGLAYPSDDGAVAKNVMLGRMADENRARLLSDADRARGLQQDAVNGMQTGYERQVLASGQLPPDAHDTSIQRDDHGNVVSVSASPSQPLSDRARLLRSAPPQARPQLEKLFADLDAQNTNTALAVRKENAAEASNPLLSFRDAAGKPLSLTDANGAPLQGADALARLPDTVRNQVQGVLDGRQPLPTGTATKDPYWKAIIQLANQVDPTFDAVNYNARANTRKDFTSGKSAGQINAINTAVGHLHDLASTGEKLGNTGIDWANKIYNMLTPGGTDRGVTINNFQTLKEGVGTELMRVWRQVGAGSEKEIEDWKSTIDATKSPEELRGAFKTIGGMLESKLSALDEQYKQGMGRTDVSAISPESRKKLDALQGVTTAAAPAGPASGPASGPKIGDIVSVGGKRVRISALHPDGTFDGDPVK
jgi:hypothetical protein